VKEIRNKYYTFANHPKHLKNWNSQWITHATRSREIFSITPTWHTPSFAYPVHICTACGIPQNKKYY
jgi:hypothetical protein